MVKVIPKPRRSSRIANNIKFKTVRDKYISNFIKTLKEDFKRRKLSYALCSTHGGIVEYYSRILKQLTPEEVHRLVESYGEIVWTSVVKLFLQLSDDYFEIMDDIILNSHIDLRDLQIDDKVERISKFFDLLGKNDEKDYKRRKCEDFDAEYIDSFKILRDRVCRKYITPFMFFEFISFVNFEYMFITTFSRHKYDVIKKMVDDNFLTEKVITYYIRENLQQ